jgi:phosphoribosylformylglycinamidine (FGAM) synthase PurS component
VFRIEVLDGLGEAVERALHRKGVRRLGKIWRIIEHVK